MTVSPPAENYDEIPYPRLTHFLTHPDRGCTLALLMGMKPAPIEHCRVLEIGCASGWNLLPMAINYPNSTFTGIDLSQRQIQDGLEDVEALGLPNVTLLAKNILDIERDFCQFDYIIAHGVFSWVPPDVREKLLAVYHENLAPNGVGFVSYNTFPGWHILEVIRNMMLFHTRSDTDPIERAERAKKLLEFLAESVLADSPYGVMLRGHNEYLDRHMLWNPALKDSLLIHDHLSEFNNAFYFYQFAEMASRHGLQYLCDADFHTDFPSNFQPENAEALLQMSHDLIELEQYMDFLRNRQFRRSLLVHADLDIQRQLKIERLFHLWVGSFTKPESSAPDLTSDAPVKFEGRDGGKITLTYPLSKAAMVCLARRWPEYIPFQSLVKEAQALLVEQIHSPASPSGAVSSEQVFTLGTDLLKAFTYSDSLVEFHSCAPRYTSQVRELPKASPWAQYESAHSNWVTNIRHELVELDTLEVPLLRLLDGSRDRCAILAALEKPVQAGEIVIREEGEPVTDHAQKMKVLDTVLDVKLSHLANAALLIPS